MIFFNLLLALLYRPRFLFSAANVRCESLTQLKAHEENHD
jgi:hypothetical protein